MLFYKYTDKRSQVSSNKLISLNNFKERYLLSSHFDIFAKLNPAAAATASKQDTYKRLR